MPTPHISVQLYSLHRQLEDDLDGTLRQLAEIGYTNVEAFDFVRRVPELSESFQRYGLKSPTGHAVIIEEDVQTPDGLLDVPPLEDTFHAAAELGVATVIDPFVAPARWQTADDVKRVADDLNNRAATAATHGVAVGYHNHAHELESVINDRPALLFFAELLDPAIKLEVDLYWLARARNDSVEILQALGNRILAVHVKDGPIDLTADTSVLPSNQVPAGRGDVPLRLDLAAVTNLQFAVVEFDHYEGNIFDGVTESRSYLQGLLDGNNV